MSKKFLAFLVTFILMVGSAVAKDTPVVLSPEKQAELEQIIKKADSLLARKYYEDSVLEYRKAIAINPKDHVVQNKLGIAFHQLQNLGMAKKQYELAKKINRTLFGSLEQFGYDSLYSEEL